MNFQDTFAANQMEQLALELQLLSVFLHLVQLLHATMLDLFSEGTLVFSLMLYHQYL
jgi:hypothetical protein